MNPDSLGSLQTFERVLAVRGAACCAQAGQPPELFAAALHVTLCLLKHASLLGPTPCQAPINRSRDRNATDKEKELGATRSA